MSIDAYCLHCQAERIVDNNKRHIPCVEKKCPREYKSAQRLLVDPEGSNSGKYNYVVRKTKSLSRYYVELSDNCMYTYKCAEE